MYRNTEFSDVISPPKVVKLEDDEFDGLALNAKWTKTNSASVESYDDKIRSALFMQFAASSSLVSIEQSYANAGDFNFTFCGSLHRSATNHMCGFQIGDSTFNNYIGAESYWSTAPALRTVKNVAGTPSQVDIVTSGINDRNYSTFMFHIQRATNNWNLYYSNNGVHWVKFATTIALTFTVAKVKIYAGANGATKTQAAFHWFRRDWITL